MKNQLQKALSLTKKTGDRLIVFDISQDIDPFVVMDLNEYEKIIIGKSEVRGLSEDELTDKINRDIAIWRSEQIQDNSINVKDSIKTKSFTPVEDILDKRRENYMPDWERDLIGHDKREFDFEENDDYDDCDNYDDYDEIGNQDNKIQGFSRKSSWKIPSKRKEAAEEVVDEDFQYLEKI